MDGDATVSFDPSTLGASAALLQSPNADLSGGTAYPPGPNIDPATGMYYPVPSQATTQNPQTPMSPISQTGQSHLMTWIIVGAILWLVLKKK